MSIKNIRQWKQSQGGESGQSLVEFSLSLIVLILIMSGLLDLGRLYYIYVALEDGAGEAALYLSINPACFTSPAKDPTRTPDCTDPNNAEWRARNSGGGMLDWENDVEFEFDVADAPTVKDVARVVLRYDYQPITPFITRLAGGRPITLTVRAAQPVVSVRPIH